MMTDQVYGMMGPFMGLMMWFWALLTLLVIVVLALLAVWLFQQVRHGPTGRDGASARLYQPDAR